MPMLQASAAAHSNLLHHIWQREADGRHAPSQQDRQLPARAQYEQTFTVWSQSEHQWGFVFVYLVPQSEEGWRLMALSGSRPKATASEHVVMLYLCSEFGL